MFENVLRFIVFYYSKQMSIEGKFQNDATHDQRGIFFHLFLGPAVDKRVVWHLKSDEFVVGLCGKKSECESIQKYAAFSMNCTWLKKGDTVKLLWEGRWEVRHPAWRERETETPPPPLMSRTVIYFAIGITDVATATLSNAKLAESFQGRYRVWYLFAAGAPVGNVINVNLQPPDWNEE